MGEKVLLTAELFRKGLEKTEAASRKNSRDPPLLVPVPAFASVEEESPFVACWRH